MGLFGRKRILVLTGPNLNMLGVREPEIYGSDTLRDIEQACRKRAKALKLALDFRQSNYEGLLVDWIQAARGRYAGVAINAGAYTHTSLAIHDALKLLDVPIVEVHLTDPKTREPFRHWSYIEPVAVQTFSGLGLNSYVKAVEHLAGIICDNKT